MTQSLPATGVLVVAWTAFGRLTSIPGRGDVTNEDSLHHRRAALIVEGSSESSVAGLSCKVRGDRGSLADGSMSVIRQSDVELSSLITSVARSVAQANSILNKDPNSALTITNFSIATKFSGLLSLGVPASTPLSLVPSGDRRFRISPTQAAKLRSPYPYLTRFEPTVTDWAFPGVRSESYEVQISATMTPVVAVTPS